MGARSRRSSKAALRQGSRLARLILDAGVLINVERGKLALTDVADEQDDPALAAITAAELLVGVELADARGRRRLAFLERLFEDYPIETYDLDVARAHARLIAHTSRIGRARGAHDLIVAATALARDREVVTTDTHGFADLPGVRVRS